MNRMTVYDAIMDFGFLIPLHSTASLSDFIDLISKCYDINNPKTYSCIMALKDSKVVQIKHNPNTITVKYKE